MLSRSAISRQARFANKAFSAQRFASTKVRCSNAPMLPDIHAVLAVAARHVEGNHPGKAGAAQETRTRPQSARQTHCI